MPGFPGGYRYADTGLTDATKMLRPRTPMVINTQHDSTGPMQVCSHIPALVRPESPCLWVYIAAMWTDLGPSFTRCDHVGGQCGPPGIILLLNPNGSEEKSREPARRGYSARIYSRLRGKGTPARSRKGSSDDGTKPVGSLLGFPEINRDTMHITSDSISSQVNVALHQRSVHSNHPLSVGAPPFPVAWHAVPTNMTS